MKITWKKEYENFMKECVNLAEKRVWHKFILKSHGENMDMLEEAKEIMQAAGCIKAFPVYDLELNDIADVKSYHENGESIELEKDINKLVPAFSQEIVINTEKPITCPVDKSLNKYLEFYLKNRIINPCNLNISEYEQVESKINSLLEKYNWIIKK